MRHSLSPGGASLSCGFDLKSHRYMQGRCRSAASNADCACSLERSYLVFLADGCRLPTEADPGRTEVAARTTWRRARSGCRDRAARDFQQKAAAKLSILEGKAGGEPSA